MARSLADRRAALLSRCKFYKGEDECPDGTFFLGWACEEAWVSSLLSGATSPVDDAVALFRRLGFPDDSLFKDGTPVAVQALLFERFCHTSDSDPLFLTESFRRYYAANWLA